MTADSRTEEIRARLDAATPGPWEVEGQGPGPNSKHMGCGEVWTANPDLFGGSIAMPAGDCYPRSGYSPGDDMTLIAHAPDDLAYLLERIEALEAESDAAIRVMNDHRCDAATERAIRGAVAAEKERDGLTQHLADLRAEHAKIAETQDRMRTLLTAERDDARDQALEAKRRVRALEDVVNIVRRAVATATEMTAHGAQYPTGGSVAEREAWRETERKLASERVTIAELSAALDALDGAS